MHVYPGRWHGIGATRDNPGAAVEGVAVPLVVARDEVHYHQVLRVRIQTEQSTLPINEVSREFSTNEAKRRGGRDSALKGKVTLRDTPCLEFSKLSFRFKIFLFSSLGFARLTSSTLQILNFHKNDPHLKRGEHSSPGLRDDHLGAQLMEFLPERLRLQGGAGADQRGMKRPFSGRLLDGGIRAVVIRMMVTVVTIVVVAVVAGFRDCRRGGDRIRYRGNRRQSTGLRRTAQSLHSSGALQTSWKRTMAQRDVQSTLALLLHRAIHAFTFLFTFFCGKSLNW